jgi:DNA-binding beta-propeller fold protein YncE
MRTRHRVVVAVSLGVLASSPALRAKEPARYHVSKQIPVPGNVSYFDFLTYDEATGRLYVSHGEEVVVLDPDSGEVIARLGGMKKVHGIALAAGKAFVTDGGSNLVKAFDTRTWKPVGEVETGKGPDAITYDPASKQILSANHGAGSVTAIDPAAVKVTGTMEFGGKAEVAQADGKGTAWVNVEDRNEIVRIDTKKKAVTAHWSIEPCKTPTGLGFDGKHRRLFAGCEESKTMVVVDADNGKVIAQLPIGDRVDGTEYDPGTGHIFNACADGTLTVIEQKAPDRYAVLQTLDTLKGGKTLALDRKKHRIFVSAKSPPPAATLVVLVVER